AEHVLVEERIDVGIGAGAFTAECDLRLQNVAPGLHRRGVPGDAARYFVADAAEPGEFRAVERGGRGREQWRGRNGAAEGAERGAVLGRDRIDVLRGAQAPGAGHVLRHDRRPARDMLADVAGDQPAVEVVAAADAVADDEIDGLAAVEILDALSMP